MSLVYDTHDSCLLHMPGNFHNSRAYLLLAFGDLTLLRARAGGGSRTLVTEGERLLRAGLVLAREVEDATCESLALLRLGVFSLM